MIPLHAAMPLSDVLAMLEREARLRALRVLRFVDFGPLPILSQPEVRN